MTYHYHLGKEAALNQLGLKVATAGTSMGPAFRTPVSRPTKLRGFTNSDPASIQAGASPGGPPQLQGAPLATPATRPGPSPMVGAPAPNPQVQAPAVSGITGAIESKNMPSAGTGTSLGIPSGGTVKSQGTASSSQGA